MNDVGVITGTVWKYRAGGTLEDSPAPTPDTLVVEAPLELRVGAEPFVTTMRTPGRDRDLALGLLYTESIIDSPEDIERSRTVATRPTKVTATSSRYGRALAWPSTSIGVAGAR